MKKIVAINAGPRSGWNTDQLIKAAAKGCEDQGAEVKYINLFKLEEAYTGCVSCFGCKREKTYGKCVLKDGLAPVLEEIRNADGLIIGSPNYLSNLTASFRALFERLVFQYLTYNKEEPCVNYRPIPVILITTSNCPEEVYEMTGYDKLYESYKQMLSRFVGPTEVLACGNTLQVEDYSKFKWTQFDPEAKKRYHDETFGDYLQKAYDLGAKM